MSTNCQCEPPDQRNVLHVKLEFTVYGAGHSAEFIYQAEKICRFDHIYFDEPYRGCQVQWQVETKGTRRGESGIAEDEPVMSDLLPVSYFAGVGRKGNLGQPVFTRSLEKGRIFRVKVFNYDHEMKRIFGVISGLFAP